MRPAREPIPTPGPGLRIFRTLERLEGLGVLVLLSPFMLLIWLWIRLDSRGPAVVRGTRLGLKRQPFEMLKFRSTPVGVDEDGGAGGEFRLTRAGRVLRRFGLDDLPQLWNVVRGEMVLVGPRPIRPEQRRAIPPWADIRFAVKPGITGLARVKGRRTMGWIDQLRLDRAFVQSDSARLRASILMRTPLALFRRRTPRPKGARSWRSYLPKDVD